MRRSLSVRVAALVFVTFMATAPAFAAPRRDDSPFGDIEQTISRFLKQVVHILDLYDVQPPR
jgi:hypothetical protein